MIYEWMSYSYLQMCDVLLDIREIKLVWRWVVELIVSNHREIKIIIKKTSNIELCSNTDFVFHEAVNSQVTNKIFKYSLMDKLDT